VWLAITITSFAAGLYQLVTLTMNFLTYPVTLETKTEFGPVQFPHIVVCGANPWKARAAHGTPLQELV
jgi:hypothetical protein